MSVLKSDLTYLFKLTSATSVHLGDHIIRPNPYVEGMAKVMDKHRYADRRRVKREIIRFHHDFCSSHIGDPTNGQ